MEGSAIRILPAKCKIPAPRERYIIREHLMDRLDQIGQRKVTILKAGAGSGKTTLLSVFIREKKLQNVKWITADESMNQIYLFWSYVLQVLEEYTGEDTENLQDCFEGNYQKEMFLQILEMFIGKLSGSEQIYLVLDDFQFIKDNFLIETIDFFIRNMPDTLHLIILSREIPALNLGTLSMEGQLMLIDENEIQLTRQECMNFLKYTLQFAADDPRLISIADRANGWIGGAQLMAIASRMKKNVGITYSGANEQIAYNYLEKEIFSTLSEEEKLFLKKTAILRYFNQEICALYLPQYNFEHMMQLILEKSLFVIMIDANKKEYRYHDILREYLLHLLEQDQEEKKQLYRQAAEICFQLLDYDECVRLLFAIGDYEELMNRLMKMPQNVVTFSYMMQIPKEQITKNANFAYQYFFCYYAAMDFAECEKLYPYLMEHFREDMTAKAFLHANLFFDVNWEFHDIAILSMEQIEELPLNQVTKAYVLVKEAYFLFVADRVDDAMQYLDQAEKIYQDTGNIYIETFVLAEKTQILEEYGDFKQARYLYHKMKRCMAEVPSMRTSYYIGISGLHIRQMRLKEAKQELDLAKEAMGEGYVTITSAYLYTLAEWFYVTGNFSETEKIIMNLAQPDCYQSVFYLARLVRYPVYRGKNREMAELFLENYKHADRLMKNMDTELLYAGIVYELGNIEEGMRLVDDLLMRARKVHNKVKIVECCLLKVRILLEQNRDPAKLLNLMAEAADAGNREIAVPFWFEKETMIKVFEKYSTELRTKLSEKDITFIQWAIAGGQKPAEAEKNAEDQLTEREQEVLEEIGNGSTNKMVADHLCISVATVKTHLINIYGKLGVNNRVAAINKYKSME